MSSTTETFYDEEQKIWSGPKRADTYEPTTNLGYEILKVLKSNPGKVVLIMDTTEVKTTAAELELRSKLIAQELLKLGLKSGDIIGLYANNTTNLSAVIIAALLCGTPWNGLDPLFDKRTIEERFTLTKPKVIFCDVENYENMKLASKAMTWETRIYTVNGKIPGVCSIEELLINTCVLLEETDFPGLKLHSEATAAILFTSGTTGKPKGAPVSHQSFLNRTVYSNVSTDSVLFTPTSFYWISAHWNFFSSFLHGATNIITNKEVETLEYFVTLVEKYRITHTLTFRLMVALLVQEATPKTIQRLSSLHFLLYGGTKIQQFLSENLFKLFNSGTTKPELLISYGMTEMGGMLSQTYTKSPQRRYDNEGKLLPNVEMRIVDNVTGDFLGPNEKGVIYARTPYKWSGYYQNVELTQKTYTDGWFKTGDIGFFDYDGYLCLCGRESDIFRTKNSFDVYPDHLENLVLQIPGVAEACIFGIPDLKAFYLTACAVVRTNNDLGKNLTTEDILEHVKQNIAEMYHITGGVYFMKQLPKTATGKLLRRKVYDLIKNEKK